MAKHEKAKSRVEAADDNQRWLASRPHASYCPCVACQPGAARVTLTLAERVADVCPGCGHHILDDNVSRHAWLQTDVPITCIRCDITKEPPQKAA